jgi:hypothetical protein
MGFLSALGGLAISPIAGSFLKDPTKGYKEAESYARLPDETFEQKAALKGVSEASKRGTGELMQQYLEGARPSGQQMLAGGEQFQAGLGGQDLGVSEALRRRSQKAFQSQYGDLEKSLAANIAAKRMERLQAPLGALRQRAAANIGIARMRSNLEAQKYAARANTIKGALGMAGAVVGGVFGGPMGAQIGSQAGGPQMQPGQI